MIAMTHIVRNREDLIARGRTDGEMRARKDLLDVVEATIRAVDPYGLVKDAMRLKGDRLSVGGVRIDLARINRIYLAGAGKACFQMARAASEILAGRIERGIFNVPEKPHSDLGEELAFHVAGHPKPDQAGLRGAEEIVAMAKEAGPEDLFIMLLSGGGSALLPYPAGGITLEEKRELTSLLLACGARIDEVNCVRKHVSEIKGGRLAQAASPARVISLIVSDVVGDPVESIASGPTSPDPSTFQDAAAILRKYGIFDRVPPGVRTRIERGVAGKVEETPKPGDRLFGKVANLIIGSNRIALEAAKAAAVKLGYATLIFTDRMEGEAREMGILAASVLNSIGFGKLPLPPPCLVMMGGETTVTLVGPGDGGRNQELALTASRKITGPGLLLSLATDGRDGPTDSAGAVVDRETCRLAEQIGLSPEKAIADNAEYELLKKLGCHLFTGHTGTNVCDVVFILVP